MAIQSTKRQPGIIPIGNGLLGNTSAVFLVISALLLFLQPGCRTSRQQTGASGFVYENRAEFVVDGDFNGDGLADVVLVDRSSGRFRIGWQRSAGVVVWDGPFDNGARGVTGVSIGKVFDARKYVLLMASTEQNNVSAVDLSAPEKQRHYDLDDLGPYTSVALAGKASSKARHDTLFLTTIYNPDPDMIQSALMQAWNGKLVTLRKLPIGQLVRRAQRLAFRPGGREYFCAMLTGPKADSFIICDFTRTNFVLARIDGLPRQTEFVVGNWQAASHLVFYQRGNPELDLRVVGEQNGGIQVGAPAHFSFEAPVMQLFSAGKYLLALHPSNSSPSRWAVASSPSLPSLWAFDFEKPLRLRQADEIQSINGAFVLGNQFGLLYRPQMDRFQFSTGYALITLKDHIASVQKAESLPAVPDWDRVLATQIRQTILEKPRVTAERHMRLYTNTIPTTKVRYVMVPIPGGTFLMGSPLTEKGRKTGEGPQHKVRLDPFWMGQCEVTWNEFDFYMYEYARKMMLKYRDNRQEARRWGRADAVAVSHPSEKPFIGMEFGMEVEGYPAIAMTQYAASMYCMWLSALTGEFYRLPTEAEWEYACRAGSTTAYSFGDDASKLPECGWFVDNSQQNGDWRYHKVGTKKPNPWGLYDMHGNVAEWCLDQYLPNYNQFTRGTAEMPWVQAVQLHPRVVRGGAFDFDAVECRSAARMFSTPQWQANDPRWPNNRWWMSDAKFVGFRIVRPLKVPSAIEMQRLWQCGTPGF